MKTKRILTFLTFIGISATLVFTACKKDKDDDKENSSENVLAKSYFTVAEGTYQNAAFPAGSTSDDAPSINSLNGNPYILDGGSNHISIETSDNIKEVLIGVKDVGGFYTVPAAPTKSTDRTHLLVLFFSQNLAKESFVIVIALRDQNGLVSAHETITVTKITAGTGTLQVSCSWDKPNDVDLHLIEPNGTEIYYGMDQSDNGGMLDVDSNAGCELDNINNENITYSSEAIIEGGTYTVLVDLWSNCDVSGNTNFSVTAIYKGAIIATSSGNNPYIGQFVPSDEDNDDPRQIMTFVIPASKAQDVDAKALKFDFSKRNAVKSPQKMR